MSRTWGGRTHKEEDSVKNWRKRRKRLVFMGTLRKGDYVVYIDHGPVSWSKKEEKKDYPNVIQEGFTCYSTATVFWHLNFPQILLSPHSFELASCTVSQTNMKVSGTRRRDNASLFMTSMQLLVPERPRLLFVLFVFGVHWILIYYLQFHQIDRVKSVCLETNVSCFYCGISKFLEWQLRQQFNQNE